MGTTRTGNDSSSNRRMPGSELAHIRISRLIYAPRLKRLRPPNAGWRARGIYRVAKFASFSTCRATTLHGNGARDNVTK